MRRQVFFTTHEKPTVNRICSRGLGLAWVAASLLMMATTTGAAPVLTEEAGIRQVCSSGADARLARALRERGEAVATAAAVLPNPSLVIQHNRTASGPDERETVVWLSVPFGVSGCRGLLPRAAKRQDMTCCDSGSRRGSVDAARVRALALLLNLQIWTGDEVELPGVELVMLAKRNAVPPMTKKPSSARVQSLRAAARARALDARAAERRWIPDRACLRQEQTKP